MHRSAASGLGLSGGGERGGGGTVHVRVLGMHRSAPPRLNQITSTPGKSLKTEFMASDDRVQG
jgi:hypothetical protein